MPLWFVLVAVLAGLALGCDFTTQNVTSKSDLSYDFREEVKVSRVSFPGTVVAASFTNISLRQDASGIIGWLKEEGSLVASGDLIAIIDMSESENELRNAETRLRGSKAKLEAQILGNPKTMAESGAAVKAKIRDLELRKNELERLRDGAAPEDLWRAETDLAEAALACSFSRQLCEAERRIAERGFDSPFSLRQKELDLQAREIERSYNRQRLEKLHAGPFPEEIARNVFRADVASCEVELAHDQFLSASASCQVLAKEHEYSIEVDTSELRRTRERLDQRRIFAPGPGLAIIPVLWGEKFAPGKQVWEEVPFMKIVSTQAYEIDASVDEPVSAVLKSGAVAWVRIDSFPGEIIPGKISFIGKSPRQQIFRRRSEFKKFPVTVSIGVSSLPIRVGLKATVTVEPQQAGGVFLPRDLLMGDEASPTVRLKGPFGVSVRSVKVAPFDADFVRWLDPPASEGTVLY